MIVIVNAENIKDIARYSRLRKRGFGKSFNRLCWDMAFIESRIIGEPVEIDIDFMPIEIYSDTES